MKHFYKNWFAKSAKDSGSQGDSSPKERLVQTSIDNSLNSLSTPLKNSFLHMFFLALLASAASLLVWHIDVPVPLSALFLGVFLFKSGQDFYYVFSEKNLANFVQLSVIEHKWFGLLKNQGTVALQLIGISSLLGLGFVLKVKVKSTNKVYYLPLWNRLAAAAFLRYCRQVLKFGVPAESSAK